MFYLATSSIVEIYTVGMI